MLPILFRLPEWLPAVGGAPIISFGVMMLLSFLVAGWVLRAELQRMDEDADRAGRHGARPAWIALSR